MSPAVKEWVEEYLDNLYITSLTVYEIEIGIRRLYRKDPAQAAPLVERLNNRLLPSMEGRILDLGMEPARIAAAYQVPDPRSERDCFIAAITQQNNMTLVTRNVKDFRAMEVRVLNPWEEQRK